jgi:hypothetical protein
VAVADLVRSIFQSTNWNENLGEDFIRLQHSFTLGFIPGRFEEFSCRNLVSFPLDPLP